MCTFWTRPINLKNRKIFLIFLNIFCRSWESNLSPLWCNGRRLRHCTTEACKFKILKRIRTKLPKNRVDSKSYNFLTQSPFFMIDLSKDSLDIALQLSETFFSSVEEKFLNFSRKVTIFQENFKLFWRKKRKKFLRVVEQHLKNLLRGRS